MSETDPIYDECGEFCPDQQIPCLGYCDECPRKMAEAQFDEDCRERLEQRLPDKWQLYDFDHLLQTVLNLPNIEKLPLEYISAFSGKLIKAKTQEDIRWKRLEAWNAKLERENNQNDY